MTKTTQSAVYSHDGPIGCAPELRGRHGVDPVGGNGLVGVQWVYFHDGPIGRRRRGYILTTGQSDAHLSSVAVMESMP
eukprot:173722-Prorocentrum_minimum.AAC.3